jgi:FtsP/CotA-like multicopper oxidase with cupredoxin domain
MEARREADGCAEDGRMPLSRRQFLVGSAAAGTSLFLYQFVGGTRVVLAEVAGPTLDPLGIPKFQSPLLIPPAMPRAGKLRSTNGKSIDYYEIAVRQLRQQVLPVGFDPTTVWGYGPVVAQNGPPVFNAPSLTIEAKWRTPVRVKWINELVDANGNYLPHLLPVDPTLHWANPPGGMAGRDTRPTFETTPERYLGPVPMVTHVHGAVGVGDESDGYAEAWYLPAAANVPDGYATTGTWYDFFATKAAAAFGVAWGPGFAVFQYPNLNRASTIWYHDHSLGMTRLNVYAGPAGFYIIRGGPDDAVIDSRTGGAATLPGPAPALGDPAGTAYHEIPIAIQDRSFNSDGSLFYPDLRVLFDEIVGDYIPKGEFSPIWNPEFFGNTIIANGATWPFQAVEQRRYRIRFLNGCQSRFLILDFSQIPGAEVWQIGNEGGFLAAPVNVTAAGNRILMGLAERADVIVDFTNVRLGNYPLANVGPDEPFGGGLPGVDFEPAPEATTGRILEFRVQRRTGRDRTTPPQFLVLPALTPLPPESVTRPLALIERMGTGFTEEQGEREGPVAALLGTVGPDLLDGTTPAGVWTERKWMDPVTENPEVGATEVWEFYNTTGDAHPMHVHEVAFEVVSREGLLLDENEEVIEPIQLDGVVAPPEPSETGFKDTVIAYPGQVTRVRAQFTVPGQYVWHCHIVEHEDNEMMRPFRIGPEQPGQPGMEG